MTQAGSALAALKDVQGVVGSFALSASGALLAKDMPAVFDEGVFAEAGPRIARLYEALSVEGDVPESCVMRFGEHKLHFRATASGLVCALTSSKINMPTLKMALTLVARRIEPELRAGSVRPTITAPPPVDTSPPPTTRRPAMYRGRPIEPD
jgi:hypothetical protein